MTMAGVNVRGRKDSVVDLFCYEQLSTSAQSNADFEAANSTPETPRAFGRSLQNTCTLEPSQNHWQTKRLSGVYSVERVPKRRRRLDFSNIRKEQGVEVVDLSLSHQSFDDMGGSENKENSKSSQEHRSARKQTKQQKRRRSENEKEALCEQQRNSNTKEMLLQEEKSSNSN